MTFVRRARSRLAAAVLALAALPGTAAVPYLAFDDGPQGASCHNYDLASGTRWRNRQGDWRDAAGTAQGDRAYSEASIPPGEAAGVIDFDVTPLAREWLAGGRPELALLVRGLGANRGIASFHAREAADPAVRPVLELDFAGTGKVTVAAAADTHLMCSTVKSLGTSPTLRAGQGATLLIRFADRPSQEGARLVRATVRLQLARRTSGQATLGAFALAPPLAPQTAAQPGIAAGYASSAALARDPAVVFVEDFESGGWRSRWSRVGTSPTFEVVARDDALKFVPLSGKALRVNVAKGSHQGLNLAYRFRDQQGREPDEIYFRYYLRFADDWRPTLDGGKLPGIAGTYDRGGWGGRKSDGENGWSMRGGFGKQIGARHPLGGRTPVGTYAYHADTADKYGEFWPWSQGHPPALENNRWYCIEQYFRVNAPGQRDGVLKVWIDGVPVFERGDIRVRDIDSIHIEEIWLNVYHGGTAVSPHDQHLFIDDVVIARRYIGPARYAAPQTQLSTGPM